MSPEPHVLKVTDNRTGESYDLPVVEGQEGTVDAKFFQNLNISCFDPGYLNTAVCKSAITFIGITHKF
jgi:citrate synthase